MAARNEIVERALAAVRALSEPARVDDKGSATARTDIAVCDPPEPTPELSQRIPGADLAERKQCYTCRGWLWWHSIHGQIVCAGCHPPAAPHLVKSWWWGNLPETKQ